MPPKETGPQKRASSRKPPSLDYHGQDTDATVIWGRAQLQEGFKQAAKTLVDRFSNDFLGANAENKTLAPKHQ